MIASSTRTDVVFKQGQVIDQRSLCELGSGIQDFIEVAKGETLAFNLDILLHGR